MSSAGEISGSKKLARDGLDFYIEPEWCVDLLFDNEQFFGEIGDPACGSGTIVRVAQRRGYSAGGWDIVHRGSPSQFGAAKDFLKPWTTPWYPANIICNPPFKHADAFIRQALTIAEHKVAMLVQAKFLYSQRRHRLFSEHTPARIYHLSSRPSMPPGELLLRGEIKATGGKLDYCWIVWSKDHRGPTQAHWLLRERNGQKEETQEQGSNGSAKGEAAAARHDAAA
jgi:hypothetical protein